MAFPVGWTRKCPLVIQHAQVTADQAAFPTLISEVCLPVEMLTLAGANAAQSDGGDIRFSTDAAGASQIACEVVGWTQNASPALSKAEIWIPANILTAADVSLYVWYHAGGGLTQPAANAAFGAQAVWDANYKTVNHWADGSTLGMTDSTGYATWTNVSATAGAGKIDGAASFNGSSAKITSSSTVANSNIVPFTVQAWVNPTSTSAAAHNVFSSGIVTQSHIQLRRDAADWNLYVSIPGPSWANATFAGAVTAGAWAHVVGTWDGANIRLYVNGVLRQTTPCAATLNAGTISSWASDDADTPTSQLWDGLLDEGRISVIARSASWILTEYRNQNAPASFVIAGTPVASGGITFQSAWARGANQILGGGYVS